YSLLATLFPYTTLFRSVRKLFPGENPVGREIVFGPDRNSVTWTIIGVAGDVRGGALGAEPPAMIYRCSCDGSRVFRAGFVIRTRSEEHTSELQSRSDLV